MTELIKSIGDWRKVGKSLSLIVTIMTGLLIFLPDQIIDSAGLEKVKEQLLPYIGILFFAAIAIFLASIIESFSSVFKEEFSDLHNHCRWSKVLTGLTVEEKKVLRKFIVDGKAAITEDLNDPVVSTLAVKRILVRTSSVGYPGGMSFPFTLQPWARKALTRKRYLIDA